MELKQNLIHRKYNKAEAVNQITIGDDYSVPEGKPDIARILQKKAELQIGEVHTEKGKVRIQGHLKLWVLYLTERSADPVSGLEAELPFDEILYLENASTGDNLKIDWDIEELQVSIIHPGKLGIRAVVTIRGVIVGNESLRITENTEGGEEVYADTGTVTMADPALERKESYRFRDEVSLPVNKPNVRNILWKNLQLRGLDIRIQEGRLAVKGEALFFVVYQGEEEPSSVQWMEQSVPFHGTVEVADLTPEMFGLLEAEVSHQDIELKPDYDGELRMFQLELVLEIHLNVYEERILPVLKDAYSTKERLNLKSENVSYEKLRMCNQTKCRISGQQKLEEERILQILGHQAKLLGKSKKVTDKGILCEGVLETQVLYITADDRQPFGCVTVSIPYSQLIEIPEMQKEDPWKVTENLEQVFINMPDGNVIEVRGSITLSACVMELCHLNNVTEITSEEYDPEEYKKRPGMMIHFVQPKESLWEIAKANRSTMEEIKKLNDLTADEVTPGQKILLLKQTKEPILS